MRVNFYVEKRYDKKNKLVTDTKGQVPIFLYASFEGKRLKIYTGEKCNPKLWEGNKIQRLKPKTDEAMQINDVLDTMEDEVKRVYRAARLDQMNKGIKPVSVSLEYMKENLSFIRQKESGFFDIFDEFMKKESSLKSWSERTTKNFNTFRKNLLRFDKETKYKLEFSSINETFLQKFIAWQVSRDIHNPNIKKNIKMLTWFLNWTTRKKHNTNLDYKDWDYKLNVQDKKENIYYLTTDEFLKLNDLEIESDSLRQVRDIFCFSCLCGLRYSDLKKLQKTDIVDNFINVTTQKTHKPIEIPLNILAKEILKKYEDYSGPGVLPVISNQKYNDYIKDLAKQAEINKPVKHIQYRGGDRIEEIHPKWTMLSSHSARKTFLTLGVFLEIPLEIMIEYTGQTAEVVKVYYEIQPEHKEREMKKFDKLRIA